MARRIQYPLGNDPAAIGSRSDYNAERQSRGRSAAAATAHPNGQSARGAARRLVEPAAVLPAQLLRQRPHKPPGEKRLMIAILADAIDCFRKHRFATRLRDRKIFEEVEEWLTTTEQRSVFSFGNICDVLEIDPSCVRRSLLENE